MTNFTFQDAQKFFSPVEIFAIKKATKEMTLNDIFHFLCMKADETGNENYAKLASKMIVKTYID